MASGSDKRQRTRQCLVRFTEQEYAEVAARADRAGRPTAAFLRAAALGDAGPRAQRRPPADHVALRQILGQCGRIGNNLNQIARQLHQGRRINIPELRETLRAYLDIRTAILTALGMSTEGPRESRP
jgi:hypothetical protein